MPIPVNFNGFKRILDSSTSGLSVYSKGQKRLEFGNTTLTTEGANTAALLLGYGTATTPVVITTADKNFVGFWTRNNATSGDNRGIYNRFYLGGEGGGGESFRTYTTVQNVAAGTAHGAHISLDFGTTGSLTGLGAAVRATLHIPNQAWGSVGGTVAAVMAEIYSDGTASDPVGITTLSFIRCVVSGDTTGDDDVLTDAVLFDLADLGASAAGNIWYDHDGTAGGDTIGEWLRVKTPAGIRYLGLSDAQH